MKNFSLLTLSFSVLVLSNPARAQDEAYLIKMNPNAAAHLTDTMVENSNAVEELGSGWVKIDKKELSEAEILALKQNPDVLHIQPNYKLKLMHDFQLKNPEQIAQVHALAAQGAFKNEGKVKDNPPFPKVFTEVTGAQDPQLGHQWGMKDIGANQVKASAKAVVVAVLDTGVDYTHEDLAANMWRNPGETGTDAQGRGKSSNGIDDDKNGFIDDHMGWDFVKNDNKPFDMTVGTFGLLIGGGNPGHGTHCAGNVGARAGNGKGIRGVAGEVQIMALRFLSERGQGTTADAVKAIRYAVNNGAKVLSNSWGSEGENPNDPKGNQALKDAIQYAESKGVLFVAAAGNGHMGKGYDNDNDDRPAYPASYKYSNIISVAAIDQNNNLGRFSNWGAQSVHIGAPGVNVFSTIPGGKYAAQVIQNKFLNMLGISAVWEGTSMAAPHVSGAAAVYWAQNPTKTAAQVKEAILKSAVRVPSLEGKTVSNGKLSLSNLLK